MAITRFTNCFLAQPDGSLLRGDLCINTDTGKIISGQDYFFTARKSIDKTINLHGGILAPGFIDAQINGAYGVDFSCYEDSDVQYLQSSLNARSCTPRYAHYFACLCAAKMPVLGYHAEGPFLFPEKKGAHDETFLLEASYGIASGVLDCIPNLTKRGVTFSIGHSAMPQMHHRNPGVIGVLGAQANTERPYYGLIADGIHVHPNAVRLAYDAHPNGAILVTDAMSLMNPRLPDGKHEWRDGRYIVKEGLRLKIDGTSTLAGSAISLDHCVRNLAKYTTISLGKAIKCATFNVAQMLGGDVAKTKGSLKPGFDADLVVLDKEGFVQSTWVDGKEVYSTPGSPRAMEGWVVVPK